MDEWLICPYLVLLSQEIRLFLLGPNVTHIVFMMFKTNLWIYIFVHINNLSDNKDMYFATFTILLLHLHAQNWWNDWNNLIKPNPVPWASSEAGCHFEFGHSIWYFSPFILYKDCYQRHVHLIWELQGPSHVKHSAWKLLSISVHIHDRWNSNLVHL